MDIPGGADRLAQLLPQTDHRAVPLPDLLPVPGDGFAVPVRPDHEAVVGQGLDLQVVIPGGDAAQLLPVFPPNDGLVELPRLAGGAQDQALPVGVDLTLGHDGKPLKVFQVGQGDEFIEVSQPSLVLGQHHQMLGHPFGLAQGVALGQGRVHLLEGVHPPVPEHPDKGDQHVSHHGRIVRGPVVVEVRQV